MESLREIRAQELRSYRTEKIKFPSYANMKVFRNTRKGGKGGGSS